MTDWRIVQGSQAERPEEFDTTTSAVTVYQRRNIKRVMVPDGSGGSVDLWQYEERQMTREEYAAMQLEQGRASIGYLGMMAEDADGMNIDHEYRITLLELGLAAGAG